MSSKTQHGQYLIDFLSDSANQNKFTNKELAQIATDKCGYFISGDTVRKILRRVNMESLALPPDVIIKSGGSSTGEVSMKPSEKELAAFQAHCEAHNLPFSKWRGFWHKTGEFSSFFANTQAIEEEQNNHAEMLAELKKLAPNYKQRKVDPKGEHMLVLPQSDIHIGKWSEVAGVGSNYNINIALERARVGTDALVEKAKLFGVKQFVVCLGNDVLHTDNGKTTTNGTPQDTDGTWFHHFRMAFQLYVSMIEQLALHADVLLVHMPSNHDWRSGYALSEAVAARFHNHPNVKTMVTERHRKYVVYGKNLIMFTHGDGAKEKDLHWHMASEGSEAWSKTKFRYVYLGHIHHKDRKVAGHQKVRTEKDLIGFTEIVTGVTAEPSQDVNIEYVRSQSGSDLWHSQMGYSAIPATEAFLHHPEMGQVARFTHFF
jgi:hypothetical protein